MDVRVDERRREDEPVRVDHPVLVRVDADPNLRHDAVVDPHVHHAVDPRHRIEDARAADDDVLRACLPDEHQATSTAVSTETGPAVSRS